MMVEPPAEHDTDLPRQLLGGPKRGLRLGCAGKRSAGPLTPIMLKKWSRRWDSNPRPTVYETVALPLSYFGLPVAGAPGRRDAGF
jgi:hypothetical protein